MVTFVSSSTGSSANSGSFTVTKPAGAQAGDVLLVFGTSNEGAWNTLPSGFTQITVSVDGDQADNFRSYAWYKVCGGSEPSSYSFGSTTASGSGAPMVAAMSCWRGVDNINPIDASAQVSGGSTTEPGSPPNPVISITTSRLSRLVYARASRSTTSLMTFSTANGNWLTTDQVNAFSGTSVRYGVSWFAYNTDLAPLTLNEPSIVSSANTTTNTFQYVALRAAPEGTADATVPSLGSVFAADHRISSTLAAQLPSLSTDFVGLGAPPEGPLNAALPKLEASFAADSTGGAFAASVPSVSAAVSGAVNPIGTFESVLPSLGVFFVAESRALGLHVIVVEPDHRSFRVTDDGDGLIPIKRSQVTDA